MTCHVCGDTRIETYDATDRRGHLCTGRKPCTRCERHARRWKRVRIAAGILLGLVLAVVVLQVRR